MPISLPTNQQNLQGWQTAKFTFVGCHELYARRMVPQVTDYQLEPISHKSRDNVCRRPSALIHPVVPNSSITRGAQLHKSHDNPSDKEDFISIRFKDSEDQRVATAHVHKDGR